VIPLQTLGMFSNTLRAALQAHEIHDQTSAERQLKMLSEQCLAFYTTWVGGRPEDIWSKGW
jgi:hypothetical protein